MNTPLHSPDEPAATSPAPQPNPRTTRREHGAGHIVAIVLGCLLLLPAFGMVVGGGAIAVGQAVATDDDGYFRFTLDRVESDGVAIATTDIWFDEVEGDGSPWVLDWLDLDLRLRVDGAEPTGDVFVGIGRSPDVERYLAASTYTEVVELDESTPIYRQVLGVAEIAPPIDQDIWAVTAAGSGEQELTWDARGGRWSVVVMNADGSPLVAADVEIGVRSGLVTPIAVTLLVVGGLGVVVAVVTIVLGARGRRTPEQPLAVPGGASGPLPPPLAEGADVHDEEREATPVG